MAVLNVGSVPYLVGRPLDLGLETERGIRFEMREPARLVDGLRDGSLDVALVSSIELFRRPGYRYVDRIAVAGEGFVGSVQVFLRRPIGEVATIALDPASRTAAALVQSLLAERAGGAPRFVTVERGVDPRSVAADAWLRIGDAALRETIGEGLPAWNPSRAWTERTGLPFVFALWIVAPGVDVEPHLAAFRRAFRRGTAAIGELAARAAREWGLPLEACRTYLARECSYEPGAAMRASLLAFREGAAAAGLCEAALEPRPIALGPSELGPIEAR